MTGTATAGLIELTEAWPAWDIWAERQLYPPGPAHWCARFNGRLIDAPTAEELAMALQQAEDG
jgi:hypothetical protein